MSIILFNTSLEIGSWLQTATQNITGSYAITVLFVLFFLLAIAALFRIPIIFYLILTLPLLIIFSMWDTTMQVAAILSCAVLIIGWQLGKSFFLYR